MKIFIGFILGTLLISFPAYANLEGDFTFENEDGDDSYDFSIEEELDFNEKVFSLYSIIGGQVPETGNPGKTSAAAFLRVERNRNGEVISSNGNCTATLIAPDLLVTASHCLTLDVKCEGQNWNCTEADLNPKNYAVNFGKEVFGYDSILVDVREVMIHSKYLTKSENGDVHSEFPNYDVAWVRLKKKAPEGYEPIQILPNIDPLQAAGVGADATLVGYGKTQDNCSDCSGTRFSVISHFQEYKNSERHKSLLVFNAGQGKGTCSGDSGGPAYFKVDSQWYLIGATSGITSDLTPESFIKRSDGTFDSTCEAGGSVYTFLGDYKNWIEETSGESLPLNEVESL